MTLAVFGNHLKSRIGRATAFLLTFTAMVCASEHAPVVPGPQNDGWLGFSFNFVRRDHFVGIGVP